MRLRIPNEVFSSMLAATTAFIGGNALHLPVWAIFIGWAGTFLAGGPVRSVFTRIYPAMAAGASFGLVVVLVESAFAGLAGQSQVAQNILLAAVILVVNTGLMYAGRTRLLGLIPGMFLGFASFFATMFGGFGFAPEQPLAAWVSVLVMLALGPLFALVGHAVAERFDTPRERAGSTAAPAAVPE